MDVTEKVQDTTLVLRVRMDGSMEWHVIAERIGAFMTRIRPAAGGTMPVTQELLAKSFRQWVSGTLKGAIFETSWSRENDDFVTRTSMVLEVSQDKGVTPNVDRLAKQVAIGYRTTFEGKAGLFGEEIRRAVVAAETVKLMSVQDNQNLPISRFVAVFNRAVEQLIPER